MEAYYIEGPGISTWDIAAPSLIISEAGGVVVDRLTGFPFYFYTLFTGIFNITFNVVTIKLPHNGIIQAINRVFRILEI